MANVVAADRLRHRFGGALSGELGGVNANYNQAIRVTNFEFPQLREDVKAVNSAESPEVQQDQLAAQVSHPQGLAGVDPR